MILLTWFLACGDADQEVPSTEPIVQKAQVNDATLDSKNMKQPTESKAPDKKDSTGECDAQLKEYSDFVDEYIALLRKANAGDLSALQGYPKLMEKAESSGQSIESLYKEDKIDADCWKKYNAITNRMSEAAMEMSGASASDKAELKELQKAQDKAVDQVSCMQDCQEKTDPMEQMTCIQGCQ
jgi:hypothetical protein